MSGDRADLDLARAVARTAPLARREHVDHLVQASLQRAEHLPSSLLLPAVSRRRHVQRAGPEGGLKTSSLLQNATTASVTGNSPPLRTEGQNSDVGNLLTLDQTLLIVIFRGTAYTGFLPYTITEEER